MHSCLAWGLSRTTVTKHSRWCARVGKYCKELCRINGQCYRLFSQRPVALCLFGLQRLHTLFVVLDIGALSKLVFVTELELEEGQYVVLPFHLQCCTRAKDALGK